MGKYFAIEKNKLNGDINEMLTEPFKSVAVFNGADYTSIDSFCDLYREAKAGISESNEDLGISPYVPSEQSDFVDEIERKQFLEDISDVSNFEERKENLKNARKGIRETYAKDVVVAAMAFSCGEKTKIEDAWKFTTFFERGKFDSIRYKGSSVEFEKTVKLLTDTKGDKQARMNLVKDHVDRLMKEYSSMSAPKLHKDFTKEYEDLMDKASMMESLDNFSGAIAKYEIPISKQTQIKMKALAEFGKAYKKIMTGRAQKIADPVYPEVYYENIPEYYKLAYGDDYKEKSLYVNGNGVMEEYAGKMQNAFTKLVIADKGIDPDDAIVCISGKQGFQSIDVVGTPEHQKEPLIVFGPDGKFQAYIDFFEDSPMVEQKDTVVMGLDAKDKGAWEKTKESVEALSKELSDNDPWYRRSSPEYKLIQANLKKLGNEGEKFDARENAKTLLKNCMDYIEKADAKEELSDLDKKRYDTVQKIKRSLQTSLTKYNLDKYLANEKNKNIQGKQNVEKKNPEGQNVKPEGNDEIKKEDNVSKTEDEIKLDDDTKTIEGNGYTGPQNDPLFGTKEDEKDVHNINNVNNIKDVIKHDNVKIIENEFLNKNATDIGDVNTSNPMFFTDDVNTLGSINDYEPGEIIPDKTEELVEKIDNDINKYEKDLIEKEKQKGPIEKDMDNKLPENGDNALGI